MARPQKTGLDYFSMDVDIEQDIKVRKLLKRKGGARALGVFTHILCQIYKNGYYADYNEDMLFVISENLYEEEDYVSDIIQYCLELGLLDKGMYDQYNVLTSHGIQARYRQVQQTFRRSSKIDRYNLVDGACDSASSPEKQVSSEETRVNAAKTPVIAVETQNNDANCGTNPSFFGVSSPIGKENRKEREIMSSTTSPAREKSFSGEDSAPSGEGIDEELKKLVKDSEWQENIIAVFGIKADDVPRWLESFGCACKGRGKEAHQSIGDLKSHFSDWLRIQLEGGINKTNSSDNGKSTSQFKSTDQRRPASVPVGKRQADFKKPF